jgi:hypothetical protein
MLSSVFIKDSGSPHLVAPIISYRIEDKEFVPMVPLHEKFINLILAYTGIFENFQSLREHILLDIYIDDDSKFYTGTEIYMCSLRQKFHSYDSDIYLADDFKHSETGEGPNNTQQS